MYLLLNDLRDHIRPISDRGRVEEAGGGGGGGNRVPVTSSLHWGDSHRVPVNSSLYWGNSSDEDNSSRTVGDGEVGGGGSSGTCE